MSMKNLFINLFVVFFLFSCGKYENGPSISLRSKKQRICNIWQSNYDNDEIFEFKEDGSCELYYLSDLPFKYEGTWEFSDDKSQISTNVSGNIGFGTVTINDTYNIIELRKDRLCIEDAIFSYENCFTPYE